MIEPMRQLQLQLEGAEQENEDLWDSLLGLKQELRMARMEAAQWKARALLAERSVVDPGHIR